jgi:hypothetical protein
MKMATTSPGYETRSHADGRTNGAMRERRTFTETKAFYKTSEFMVWVLTVAGVLVVTYINDSASLSNWHGWLLVTVLSSVYMLSRGIAKAGTREPYAEDYDS